MYKMFYGDNFKLNLEKQLGEDELIQLCSKSDTYLDERTGMISANTDLKGIQWYLNYLETTGIFAKRNPKAYPTYLLDLGFIPIVYLPSPCMSASASMIAKLHTNNIEFVAMRPMSFVYSNFSDAPETSDAWVSKLEIEAKLGIPIDSITSTEVVRRLFYGK